MRAIQQMFFESYLIQFRQSSHLVLANHHADFGICAFNGRTWFFKGIVHYR